ncbi:phage tail protein [Paenibacillus lautus]|uniref:phage tail protein n=1 Tax=Paenibacillus lautus TaxID=1401 RepID=UPI003D28DFCD
MASNTPNLGLLKKDPMVDGNETFNIETMLNENWDKVDEAVGQVLEDLGNIDVELPDASLTQKGIVQLSNATNGARENVAATEKAVKAAYDEALEGKQLGVEQKNNVVAALNSIGVTASTSETWAQLIPKIAAIIRSLGDATAADVLIGKRFSNASGNNILGKMPNRSAENNHMPGLESTVWVGDRFFIRPPAGYYDGGTWVTTAVPGLKPENLRAGANVVNVQGTFTGNRKNAGIASNLGNKSFLHTDGTSFTCGYINVSGLGFLPSLIIISYSTDGDFILGYNSNMIVSGYPTYNGLRYENGSTIWGQFRLEAASVNRAYITNGGFQLPIPYFAITSSPVYWRAYE